MNNYLSVWKYSMSFSGKNVNVTFSSLLLIIVFSLVLSESAVAEDIVQVGGTGTGTLLIQRVRESYVKLHPGVQVKTILPPMGSNGSLRALAASSIQIAIVTFPTLYPAKPEDAQDNNIIPWARTPLIFTGRDIVSGTKLTLGQVSDIYSGRLTQWPDGKPVRLISRSERESDTRILRAISPKMDEAVMASIGRVGMPFAENDLDNQQLLERTPGSFGAIGLGQLLLLGSPLKPVNLDGIISSVEEMQKGDYRIEKPLYLVTNKSPSQATMEFIRYLQSPEVVKMIRRFGFIPVPR